MRNFFSKIYEYVRYITSLKVTRTFVHCNSQILNAFDSGTMEKVKLVYSYKFKEKMPFSNFKSQHVKITYTLLSIEIMNLNMIKKILQILTIFGHHVMHDMTEDLTQKFKEFTEVTIHILY